MIFSLDSNMVKFAKILACQKFGNQPSRPEISQPVVFLGEEAHGWTRPGHSVQIELISSVLSFYTSSVLKKHEPIGSFQK